MYDVLYGWLTLRSINSTRFPQRSGYCLQSYLKRCPVWIIPKIGLYLFNTVWFGKNSAGRFIMVTLAASYSVTRLEKWSSRSFLPNRNCEKGLMEWKLLSITWLTQCSDGITAATKYKAMTRADPIFGKRTAVVENEVDQLQAHIKFMSFSILCTHPHWLSWKTSHP